MVNNSFNFVVTWSDRANDKFIDDFCYACNSTFGDNTLNRREFSRKYKENIYGNSVLCVCYDDDNHVVGARALWRNDLGGKEAYQPCDTCVLKEYRCQGIFRKMTESAINFLSNDSIIYNFPNNNSRPLYLKLGWDIYGVFKPRLWHGYKAYALEHSEVMNEKYYDWWLSNGKYKYIQIHNHYFLVREYGNLFYIVLAEISIKTAEKISKAAFKPLLYWSSKSVFYNGKKESKIVVFRNATDIHIPIWKVDALSND